MYRYQRRSIFRYFILFSLLLAWIGLYTGGYISDLYLESLFDINSLVLLASRVPQILQNYATGSTGQLSVITYFLNFAGSAARILTTLNEENAGTSMLRGAILSRSYNRWIYQFFLWSESLWCDVNDTIYLRSWIACSVIAGTLLNGIMLGQIVRYGNKREKQDWTCCSTYFHSRLLSLGSLSRSFRLWNSINRAPTKIAYSLIRIDHNVLHLHRIKSEQTMIYFVIWF